MRERKTSVDAFASISANSLFASFDDRTRRAIAGKTRVRKLASGECLWREGDRADALGLLVTGRLKLCRTHEKREVIVDVALPGELVGEIAFTLGSAYSSDVVSLRSAQVLMIPVAPLRSALARDVKATTALALELARQVLRLTRALEDRSHTTVEARVASALVRLAERAGHPFDGGVLIPLRLRRMDLAALSATTLESASRKIAEWHRKGWVVPQPAGYLIRNIAALEELSAQSFRGDG